MVWTTPVTRASGDKITDSIWNLQLIDNLSFLHTDFLDFACVQDQKVSGTNGGTFTLGAWRTRDLNTISAGNLTSFVSVNANQFTLLAGTYVINASAPGMEVAQHVCRLYNITTGSELSRGSTEYSLAASTTASSRSVIWYQFTIAATSVFEIQHQSIATKANYGFGIASTLGTEVYTIVNLWKRF